MEDLETANARHMRHLNMILQCALRLGSRVPEELRKVMSRCLMEEDEARGTNLFYHQKKEKEKIKHVKGFSPE